MLNELSEALQDAEICGKTLLDLSRKVGELTIKKDYFLPYRFEDSVLEWAFQKYEQKAGTFLTNVVRSGIINDVDYNWKDFALFSEIHGESLGELANQQILEIVERGRRIKLANKLAHGDALKGFMEEELGMPRSSYSIEGRRIELEEGYHETVRFHVWTSLVLTVSPEIFGQVQVKNFPRQHFIDSATELGKLIQSAETTGTYKGMESEFMEIINGTPGIVIIDPIRVIDYPKGEHCSKLICSPVLGSLYETGMLKLSSPGAAITVLEAVLECKEAYTDVRV